MMYVDYWVAELRSRDQIRSSTPVGVFVELESALRSNK